MSVLLVLFALLLSGAPLVMFWQGLRAARLEAAPLRDPLAWLIAKNPGKARVMAGAGALIAVAILVLVGFWLSRVPWQLNAQSPTVMSSGGRCDQAGAVYIINLNGGNYVCGGGDVKCPEAEVAVAYDPNNPNHCRVRSNVDRPSLYELQTLLFALIWLCFAAAVATWQGFPQAGAPMLPQSSLHRACVVALGVVLAAVITSGMMYRS
jgi:hypothetical protein